MRLLPLIFFLLVPLVAGAEPYTPTSQYTVRSFHAFRVLIHPDVVRNNNVNERLLQHLDKQIAVMARTLPPFALAKLQRISIWIEPNSDQYAGVYHRSSNNNAATMRHFGYNPDKIGAVTMIAEHIFKLSAERPGVLLHEFAHAYHDTNGARFQADIDKAYAEAVRSGAYQNVPIGGGKTGAAYAITNDREYFAELTAAYFDLGTMTPRTKADLKQRDAMGFELMRRVWDE